MVAVSHLRQSGLNQFVTAWWGLFDFRSCASQSDLLTRHLKKVIFSSRPDNANFEIGM